jgi:AcrR family transcriptional regulator
MSRTPTADVRTALVDAAARVLERDGVAGLTVRTVAAEAQVAPMGVYNHLKGKSGLLLAVLQRGFDELTAAVTPASSVPTDQRLVQSGRCYRRFALTHPRTYALMFNTTDADKAAYTDAVGPHAAPAFQALIDVVADSQHAGVVRAGEPADLALQIWSAVHGGVSLELTRNFDDEVQAEQAYERLLEMIARGVRPDD